MKKAKNIFKEIFILILVLIAIVLVLAILLYNYNPTSKVVPTKISYETPKNISEEISSQADTETVTPVTITYELDETHINNSKKSGSYDSGKQNPFAKPVSENTEDSTNDNQNTKDENNTTNTATSGNNSSSQTNNTTRYLPDTGTK